MFDSWPTRSVQALQDSGVLLVEDGNHGEVRPRPEEFVEAGTVFVRAADMEDGRIKFRTASRISDVALARIRKGIGAPRDILLSHKGTVGKLAVAPNACEPFICSPQTTFWRVLKKEVLDRRFLYYFMGSAEFRRQLDAVKGETDMADYVSLTAQRRLAVPVPPIRTQAAIADVLAPLDERIDLNRQMNETLEAMARALFKDWFVDFGPTRAKMEGRAPYLAPDIWALFPDRLDDEGTPEGWSCCRLDDVADLNPPERLPQGAEAPYLDMGALPTRGSWPDKPMLRAAGSGPRFRNGDTLVARITPCLENGKTAFVARLRNGEVAWGSTEFIVIRPRAPFPAQYGYLLAREEAFREHAIRSMTGTSGRQRVQAEALRAFAVVRPSADVLRRLGEVSGDLFDKIRANELESETLAATRDLLLPKLMSGELRVREAERVAEAVL